MSKEAGRKIGRVFEEAKEVIIIQTGGKEGKHIKMRVMANIAQPLLRETMVCMNGMNKWATFKYERCPDFCYDCGRIGHNERSCKTNMMACKR